MTDAAAAEHAVVGCGGAETVVAGCSGG